MFNIRACGESNITKVKPHKSHIGSSSHFSGASQEIFRLPSTPKKVPFSEKTADEKYPYTRTTMEQKVNISFKEGYYRQNPFDPGIEMQNEVMEGTRSVASCFGLLQLHSGHNQSIGCVKIGCLIVCTLYRPSKHINYPADWQKAPGQHPTCIITSPLFILRYPE